MLEVVVNVAREALLVDARALVAAHLPDEPVAKLDVGRLAERRGRRTRTPPRPVLSATRGRAAGASSA